MKHVFLVAKGGFPVIAETNGSNILSKEVSQVILAVMVLVPNFTVKTLCE